MIKTAESITDFSGYLSSYKYQPGLTRKLDGMGGNFDQHILNEIVLWKVNRYACFSPEVIALLNQIKKGDESVDDSFKREILTKLLGTKGVALAMASTILRFKNPNVFQIIDQRVYRILYGEQMGSIAQKNEQVQIDTYIQYLKKLKEFCERKKIQFSDSDRILYMVDKEINGDIKIKY